MCIRDSDAGGVERGGQPAGERQVHRRRPLLGRRRERVGERLQRHLGRRGLGALAVSYTHLDVYKRQILNLSAALYTHLSLKRVFFSAYLPVVPDPLLPLSLIHI